MAAGATIHTFDLTISDVDRGVYESVSLRAARHPSETEQFLVTRVLAYALEYVEGIAFSEGISTTKNEPAVLVRDATGSITGWIEIGGPDAERLHFGSKLADRTVVYTHRDPAKVAALWAGKKIHRGEEIELRSFDPGFVDDVAGALGRRSELTVSLIESRVYVELDGRSFSSELHSQPAL
ncbi:YaeQ family protein [Schumannella luteola]|uniref:Uncharacterized protein YaeQ n=1 Tax=Schumannella luteola TaxID=472059 RepID=A0A852YD90_9MICO|nr:YaeQ family protein [Schumannella luteola]NYG99131.1 uncharacterized protein YaeQ [Schumannella luteola]TPX02329.1 YaeQ family protein [Schumannella luteola]